MSQHVGRNLFSVLRRLHWGRSGERKEEKGGKGKGMKSETSESGWESEQVRVRKLRQMMVDVRRRLAMGC